MPLPIIADTIRVSVEGLATNSHQWANVLHFRKTGALSFAAAIALIDPILATHYTTNSGGGASWKNHAPSTASVQRFRFLPLDGTSAQVVNTHIIAGASAGDALPASVALVVTLRTALRGRSHRGRVYQGPNLEADSVLGAPTAGIVADLAAQWTYLITTATGGTGVSLVVASYKLATADDVTTCTVDSRWDTQRRRLNA